MKVLVELSDITGETAHMSVLSDNILSSIANSYSTAHGTMVMMEDAEILDLHATGSGLAVLAFSPTGFVDKVLSGPLSARTIRTETDPDTIRAQLPEIRARGYASSLGGFEEDVHSFATPCLMQQLPVLAL